jgi:iron complex outermembrane receptor protein
LWRHIENLSFRVSVSTGFRAPGIGELFGGAAREDFTFLDPCADYTGQLGSTNGGRDDAQSATIQANCASLGVPAGLAQVNPQLSAVSAGNSDLIAETSESWTVGFVYGPGWTDNISWLDAMTFSLDYYELDIDDAIQGRAPGDVIDGCVDTLDTTLCGAVERTAAGRVNLVNNQLQNIGKIESSGYDIAFSFTVPTSNAGDFMLTLDATHLADYTEISTNPDGTTSANDLTGVHTDETFQRAFPEWRMVTRVNWVRENWGGSLAFRWVDEMVLDDGVSELDSAMFTDIQASYNRQFSDQSLTLTAGINNVLDEDPPVCFPCGVIGMSTVSHDLPGRVGYLRLSWEM